MADIKKPVRSRDYPLSLRMDYDEGSIDAEKPGPGAISGKERFLALMKHFLDQVSSIDHDRNHHLEKPMWWREMAKVEHEIILSRRRILAEDSANSEKS